jgi:hypothetical protein
VVGGGARFAGEFREGSIASETLHRRLLGLQVGCTIKLATVSVLTYNLIMPSDLRHDWAYIETLTRESEAKRLRAATPEDKSRVYASLYNAIWNARRDAGFDSLQLDQWQWKNKLAVRQRMVQAFTSRDRYLRERAAGNDTG